MSQLSYRQIKLSCLISLLTLGILTSLAATPSAHANPPDSGFDCQGGQPSDCALAKSIIAEYLLTVEGYEEIANGILNGEVGIIFTEDIQFDCGEETDHACYQRYQDTITISRDVLKEHPLRLCLIAVHEWTHKTVLAAVGQSLEAELVAIQAEIMLIPPFLSQHHRKGNERISDEIFEILKWVTDRLKKIQNLIKYIEESYRRYPIPDLGFVSEYELGNTAPERAR